MAAWSVQQYNSHFKTPKGGKWVELYIQNVFTPLKVAFVFPLASLLAPRYIINWEFLWKSWDWPVLLDNNYNLSHAVITTTGFLLNKSTPRPYFTVEYLIGK